MEDRCIGGKKLDLAVAIGAAYFGLVRRGQGVRIDARLARAYYLQVSVDPPKAICVMPGDAMSLETHRLDQFPIHLEVGKPVQFPIWYSSTHLVHQAGEIVAIDPDRMISLPVIQTVIQSNQLRRQQTVPVHIEAQLTEIGTLDLAVVASSSRWKLAFDLRSSTETDRLAHAGTLEKSGIVDQHMAEEADEIIRKTFQAESPTNLPKT